MKKVHLVIPVKFQNSNLPYIPIELGKPVYGELNEDDTFFSYSDQTLYSFIDNNFDKRLTSYMFPISLEQLEEVYGVGKDMRIYADLYNNDINRHYYFSRYDEKDEDITCSVFIDPHCQISINPKIDFAHYLNNRESIENRIRLH